MAAIENNPETFRDKVVLDIGCGTGILSIFAAKAGARKVYGVEFADIADYANEIVKKNNFADKVTIIKSKVEEANIPEKVDIIISEWMGYCLIYESMLDSVLFARDKWLKPDGIILPDRATMHVAGIEDNAYKRNKSTFWENVYDINMDVLKPYVLKEPLIDYCEKRMINTNVCNIFEIDLYTVKKEQLDFSKSYEITFFRNDTFNGIVIWFDIFFDKLPYKVQFSTGPFSPKTHWKQTILYSDKDIFVNKGEMIKGSIACRKSTTNFRALDIKVSYHYIGQNSSKDMIQLYKLK